MRTRTLRTFAAAACLLSLSAGLTAESDFSELDIQQQANAANNSNQLADAKDLLAASEILRLESEKQSREIDEADKSLEAERQFVRSMSLW